MDVLSMHEIAESGHRLLNPLTDEKLMLLGDLCRLRPGQRMLDLASGKGEMLCRWADAYGIEGLGVDISTVFVPAARARAVELGVADRVAFELGDAAQAVPPADGEGDAAKAGRASIGGEGDAAQAVPSASREGNAAEVVPPPVTSDGNAADAVPAVGGGGDTAKAAPAAGGEGNAAKSSSASGDAGDAAKAGRAPIGEGEPPPRDADRPSGEGSGDADGRRWEYDVVACIGATWIGGGLAGTAALLRRAVRADGLVLIGEPYWADDTPDAAYEALHTTRDVFTTLGGTLERLESAGLELLEMVLADGDSWDRYVAPQWWTVSDWLRAHPDSPDAPAMREYLRDARRTHMQYQRRYLGWGVFVCRVPRE
ncbi:methyltransferase domain-containing protein [Dactylosporangium sp. NPDC051541]|uniref:SAM-dependent methyltransferase n=1 Tax=Dactylosporangium sp. NPDC051541 TaxID=3363977 RepID=UPI0037AE1A79